MIGNIAKAWPDSVQNLESNVRRRINQAILSTTYRGDTCTSVGCLNPEPKHSQNTSAHYGKVAKPVTKAGAGRDGERNMQVRADSAVEYSGQSVAYTRHERYEHGIGCRQTYSN